MFRLIDVAVASSLLLSAYASARPIDKLTTVPTHRFTNRATHTSISFETNGNKVYVLVRLNQTGPCWFILDTGAEANVVDADVAKKLGLSLKNPSEATGGGEGTLSRSVGSGVSIEIGDLELTEPEVEVIPLNHAISATEGRRVDGLLGHNSF